MCIGPPGRRMTSIARRAALVPACLGLAVGASFGHGAGWAVIQLCLIGVAFNLTRPGIKPRQAAASLSIFNACMFVAGHAGVALAIPSEVRILAMLPLCALVSANAACAWLVGYAAVALPVLAPVRVALLLPSLWTLQEWLFSLSPMAIPWLRLGYSQGSGGLLSGALPYGGVLLASWLMLSMGGLVAITCRRADGRSSLRPVGALALVLVALTVVAGTVQWTRPSSELRVDLVQSGMPSEQKSHETSLGQLLNLYSTSLRTSNADLIVTSQLAVPKTPSALPLGFLAWVSARAKRTRADVLLGIYLQEPATGHPYNAVIGVGPSGPQQYVKHQLFPFGEFIPLKGRLLSWVQSLRAAPLLEMAAGPIQTEPLIAKEHRLALSICFEAAFGGVWRAQVATADVLVNMSSDSAIGSPQFHRQFRQLVQTRAREFQKPLLRTSDVRGTFVVDSSGRITDEMPDGIQGVLRAATVGRTGLTPYARWGDAVALLVAILASCASLLWPARPASSRASAVRFGDRSRVASAVPQEGQVLPAATVLLLIVAGMFYLMVNAGQNVTEKVRVTNAADAAAYSAGVVQARSFNYQAYLNRAMVANEIAIAQMVSFASWVNYFATASDNFGANSTDVNFFILPNPQVALLDVAFGGSGFAAAYFGGRTVQDYANYIVDGAGLIVTAHDVAVRALSLSQQAVQANLTTGIRQEQVANDVVEAMDPKLRAEVVRASLGFDTFTRPYARSSGSGDERGRFADVTLRSRDPFTRERNWTASSFDIPFVRSDPALKKRGGTDLVGFDEWRAVDTLELHGRTWGCGKWGLSWCDDIRRPIGWGAAEVDAGGGDAGRGFHGNAYADNPNTASRADGNMISPRDAVFSGLPDSMDIGDTSTTHAATTEITIRVYKSQSDTQTSGNAAQAKPTGRLALFNGRPAAGEVAALSRAQVFFDRIAARADGKVEVGSLYNPYWRVRLIAPTAADRTYAAAKQGGLGLP